MKRYTILIALFFLAFNCFAEDLTIALGDAPFYQIVYPDQKSGGTTNEKKMLTYVNLAAKFLQTAIMDATGATLPIYQERYMNTSFPAIYIGNTNALQAAGLSSEDFEQWEHAIVVKGKDIFLYGTDWPSTDSTFFPNFTMGSLKATCVFVEKFVSTRVVGIDKNYNGFNNTTPIISPGVRTLPMDAVTVPADFQFRSKPRFLNSSVADGSGLLFQVANNYCWACGANLDVHWHKAAIPPEVYYNSHPEYFALINGNRYYHAERPQYCLSNPEVQELIYQNALQRARNGARIVEFGQSDGFMGCQCEYCQKMYNTDDWGEKLWRLHSEMCARLKNECPNVKVAIASYGPTWQIPKSFNKFPVATVIDLAPVDNELLQQFQTFNVPDMATWTYFTCEEFNATGFSPGASFKDLHEQNSLYRTLPISYIYDCGLYTCKALYAPWIYAWGRWREDELKDESAATILHDYCLYTYGETAGAAFERFYNLLDSRMEAVPVMDAQDYNDFSERGEGVAISVWQARYPTEVLAQLVQYFDEAIALCDPNDYLLPPLKAEFEYLKLSATVCNAYKAWVDSEQSYEAGCALADALEARNSFIKKLSVLADGDSLAGPGFEYFSKKTLQDGGIQNGKFGGVFDMNPSIFRQRSASVQAVKVTNFNDVAWNDAPECTLMPLVDSSTTPLNVTFKVGCTDSALLLKITAPLVNPKTNSSSSDLWAYNDVKEIFVAAGNSITQFAFSPVAGSAYVQDVAGGSFAISNWTHTDTVKNGVWYSEVTLPYYDALRFTGLTYVPGKKIFLQVGFSTKNRTKVYCWNANDSSKDAYLTCSQDLMNSAKMNAVTFTNIRKTFLADFGRVQLGTPLTETTTAKVTAWNKTLPTYGEDGWTFNWERNSGSSSITSTTPLRFYLEGSQTATVHLSLEGSGGGRVGIQPVWYNAIKNLVLNDSGQMQILNLSEIPEEWTYKFNGANGAAQGGTYFTLEIFLYAPGGTLNIKSVEVETPCP